MAYAPVPSEQPSFEEPCGAEARAAHFPQAWPFVDRRSGEDRRERPTRWYDSLLGHRRRHRGRRRGESRNIYVDLYHSSDLIILALVFLLNLLDAGLTLVHLSSGGVEQNPLMEELLRGGPWLFLLEKCLVVGICLATIAIHKTFLLARIGACTLLACYTSLTIWHLTFLI